MARGELVDGRYRLLERRGAGTQGTVWAAEDLVGGGRCIVKAVAPLADAAARSLFTEFRHLARLAHPSLVRVRDLAIARTGPLAAGTLYFTADLVEGAALRDATARVTGAALARTIWIAAHDVAGALAVVHGAGLLHHDVAPQNVMWVGAGDDGRAVLLDLGLSTARRALGELRGTPAFLAPEALAGDAEPRSDLYALGATLWHAVRGAPPFGAAGEPAALVRAILREPPARLDELPRPLAEVIARLLAKSPDERPSSAAALLDELDSVVAILDRPPRARDAGAPRVLAPPPIVGADEALASLVSTLAARARGAPTAPVRLWGPAGAGADDVVAAALRRDQIEAVAAGRAPPAVVRGALEDVAARLGVDTAEDAGIGGDGASFMRRVARAVRQRDAVTVLEVGGDARASALVGALASAAAGPGLAIVVVGADAAPAPCPPVVDVAVGAVDVAAIARLAATMIGRAPPTAWAHALHRASGGLRGVAADVVRAIAAHGGDPFATSPVERAADSDAATAAAAARLAALDDAARAAVETIALGGGRVTRAIVLAGAARGGGDDVDGALHAAIAAEVVRVDGEVARVEPAIAAAARRAIDPGRAREIADAALDRALAIGAPVQVVAALAEHAGRADRAALLVRGARAALAVGNAAQAAAWAALARAADPRADAAELEARAMLVLGRYDRALAAAEAAIRGADDPARARAARLLAARAHQRAGDIDRAEASLASLYREAPADDEIAGAYARLLVSRARYREAAAIAGEASGPARGARTLRVEAAGLAALYQGELDAADRAFAGLETGARADDDVAQLARALALRGMVAQQRGDLALAGELHGKAGDEARRAGDVHAAAVADLNRGSALAERGRFAESAPLLAQAAAALAELGAGRVAELAWCEFNLGNSLLGLGDVAAARAATERARARADGAGIPHIEVFARVLAGDCARRAGELGAARAAYREALERARERPGIAPLARLSAVLPFAEVARSAAEALAALDEAEPLIGGDDDRDRLAIAQARALVAWRELPGDRAATGAAIAELARAARGRDKLERAWRALVVAAQLARAAGDDGVARARARDALALLGELRAAAPAWSQAMADDPDARAAAELAATPSAPAPDSASRGAFVTAEVARLRRLLALSRRLNAELGLDRLLDEVIDAAIEMTAAERGFLLLRSPSGTLDVVVARNFADGALAPSGAGGEAKLSRSIAEQAASTGEPVITIDAGLDERFGAAASVSALRLRSVMAVPLRQKGRITGCVYVDHRLRGGAFDDDAAVLLLELADIAAVAIENARLAEDLRRRTDEIDALNARLAADIADRDAELVRVRAEAGGSRSRLRHAYPSLVGRSPALLGVLEVIDRAAHASVPVVVVGESGTGKELVARALHEHGPRRAQPFVAINCGALPESLLESELFGHVRGAFTGADRDRKGLFEIAHGGTLFLDEVADTGPAMQAKLLRVLQDGALRRVGDDRPRQVDVRVIAATQRPLGELVAAGRFRDDLRYRLEVITLEVPPLRARREDLALLVPHILARLAPGRAPKLTRAATAALADHDWPGNVRELENALARAVALGGDVIDLDDLPDVVARRRAPSAAGAAPPNGDLRLKPAIALTERAYIDAAMSKAKNNQTVAARLLGLSRFGLQKKLRRLAGREDDADAEADE